MNRNKMVFELQRYEIVVSFQFLCGEKCVVVVFSVLLQAEIINCYVI